MRRFLYRDKKGDEGTGDDLIPTASNATDNSHESHESVDVGRMFKLTDSARGGFSFVNDPDLNMNPCILNAAEAMVDDALAPSIYTGNATTIFSSDRQTFSTKQSSYNSSGSGSGNGKTLAPYREYGQPLQIFDIPEDCATNSHENQLIDEILKYKLSSLAQDLSYVMNQYNSNELNLSKTVINCIDIFKQVSVFINSQRNSTDMSQFPVIDCYNSSDLRKVMRIYLNLYDNLLADDVFVKLKLMLTKNFNDFIASIDRSVINANQIMTKPQYYSVGCNQGKTLPNAEKLAKIIDKIANTQISIKSQNGSFVAPITRGISSRFNILCLYFAFPDPTEYHSKLTKTLSEVYDDIHIVLVKNQIELASLYPPQQQPPPQVLDSPGEPLNRFVEPPSTTKFKLPFRVPTDINSPPMALSLSVENSVRTSGTLGGYIYPIIDPTKPDVSASTMASANSKFALTCGHVCLESSNVPNTETKYPHVSSPSSVLISLYKLALQAQLNKTAETNKEARVAYSSVIQQLDSMFPLKRVKVFKPREMFEVRNLPMNRFGQIVWGERTMNVVKDKETDEVVAKRLSDIAIIKVNKKLNCQNYLGDDIAFNEFDPALMFENMYVREVLNFTRKSSINIDLQIDDVDSTLDDTETSNHNGLPVFKYGSTTKFTKGNLNGIRLVYWLEGAIHSSEFVVNSMEHNTAFAAGGDSGAWILSKLEDVDRNRKGLGVIGMLHSFDGEHKQFGLFAPMCEILQRLEETSKLKWGVVGVAEKHKVNENSDEETEEDDEFDDTSSKSSSDTESMDGALPPEID
jgi:hypothetical protein